MKKLLTILALTLMSSAMAQNWLTDFQKAKEIAAKENKQIVMVFQGSDWCAPCIKLDREIWSTSTFIDYSTANFVLVKVDFPRRKKNALPEAQTFANAQLAEKYNTRGIFPFVVLVNATGEVLGETGYKKMSPENYIEVLNAFTK
mgnify:CR=1 FL=1